MVKKVKLWGQQFLDALTQRSFEEYYKIPREKPYIPREIIFFVKGEKVTWCRMKAYVIKHPEKMSCNTQGNNRVLYFLKLKKYNRTGAFCETFQIFDNSL